MNLPLIVFTESKETAEYLEKNLDKIYKGKVISHSSKSSKSVTDRIIENYDPKHRNPKDDLRILVSTEVLSEGVNLHRSNVVINYDLPWNPTRVIQRVGRVNRVGTAHDFIYIYNFFPTVQSNDAIKLEEAAIGKIQAFHDMLGEDTAYLTDGEIVNSYELFKRVNSKELIEGEEEESELKYLAEIRAIRDNNPELFEAIKRLPKKARSAKEHSLEQDSVLTFFRKGKLRKMFISSENEPRELDFYQTAEVLRSSLAEKRETLNKKFYEYLEKNKQAFKFSTIEEIQEYAQKGGRSNEVKLMHIIKAILKAKGFTEDDEDYLRITLNLLEDGIIPKHTAKTIIKNIGNEMKPLKIYAIIRIHIPTSFFTSPVARISIIGTGPREVILSEYLIPKD